jgi:hypothetical protein
MKKSLIYITAGIAAVGFAVPAFAAHGDTPEHIAPTQVTVATAAKTVTSAPATSNTVDSVTVATTSNSVEDNATSNSVEDISGPCDEAEHANDPRCTGVTTATAGADDSGHDVNDDNPGRHSGSDDSGSHGGSDD